jgi:hypothetical protein
MDWHHSFITLDRRRLKEVAHGMDTQVNESFNNSASWVSPKNKVYCGSRSLSNRLAIAVGITSVGVSEYFKRLHRVFGITMMPSVAYFLHQKETTRFKRLEKIRTKEKKKERLKRKYEQLKDDEVSRKKTESKEDIAAAKKNRDACYKSGMNMEDVEEQEQQQPNARTTKKPPPICPFCGKKGHCTTRSKQCLHYNGLPKDHTTVPINAEAERLNDDDNAEEIEAFDALPFSNSGDSVDPDGTTGEL